MKQRVCLFMADFSGGGAERVMVNVANGLSERGYDVEILVARETGKHRSLVREGITVRALSVKLRGTLVPLCRYLRRTNPACILAAGEQACELVVIGRALSGRKSRLVLSLHSAIETPNSPAVPNLKQKLSRKFLGVLYRRADRVVAVSGGLRQDAIQRLHLDPNRTVAIYNPIYDPKLEILAAEPLDHPWLPEGKKPRPVIVAIGRLVPEKAFDLLIRAFAIVRKQMDARLVILGEGPDLDSLRELSELVGVHGHTDFAGFAKNPYPYMARADLLVMSSRWEGFGNVLVEALSVGTPVVSTNCKYGPREILEDGKFGILVPPESPTALADGILSSFNRPVDTDCLRQRARVFSIDAAVDQYETAMGLRDLEQHRTGAAKEGSP